MLINSQQTTIIPLLIWKGIDISLLVEELLFVFKPLIENYIKMINKNKKNKNYNDTNNNENQQTNIKNQLLLQKEVIKSTLLLSDLFSKAQFMWMLQIFQRIFSLNDTTTTTSTTSSNNNSESNLNYLDDFLVDQYVTIGICKAESVLEMSHVNLMTTTTTTTANPKSIDNNNKENNNTNSIPISLQTTKRMIQSLLLTFSVSSSANSSNSSSTSSSSSIIIFFFLYHHDHLVHNSLYLHQLL